MIQKRNQQHNVCDYVEEVKRYIEQGVQDRDYQIRPPVLFLRLVEPPTALLPTLRDCLFDLRRRHLCRCTDHGRGADGDGGHCIVSVF